MPGVELKEVQPQTTLVVRRRVTMTEMAGAFPEMIGKTFARAAATGAGPIGGPFCRYLDMSDAKGMWEIEVGVPVSKEVPEDAGVHSSSLPGGQIAATRHAGPFDQVGSAYARIEEWISENGYEKAGAPWEVYLTDPTTEPDPNKYQTDVFWPVKRA